MTGLDLSEFERLGRKTQRKPCQIAAVTAKTPVKDRAKVKAALESENDNIRRGAVRWLEARKLPVNLSSLTYHRQQKCDCYD